MRRHEGEEEGEEEEGGEGEGEEEEGGEEEGEEEEGGEEEGGEQEERGAERRREERGEERGKEGEAGRESPMRKVTCCRRYGQCSLASQTQPTPARIAFSITHGERSGDSR